MSGRKWRAGCPCCVGTCGDCCVTVTGCFGAALTNATVTILQGVTVIGTCTTNASGVCCVNIPSAATYSIQVDPPAGSTGYVRTTVSHAMTCTTNIFTVAMTLDSGFHCLGVGNCCGPSPLPDSLFVTAGGATATLTWSSQLANGNPGWSGCVSISTSSKCAALSTTCGGSPATLIQLVTGTVTILYELECLRTTPANFQLRVYWCYVVGDIVCSGANTPALISGTCAYSLAVLTLTCGPPCPTAFQPMSQAQINVSPTGTCANGALSLTGTFPATYHDSIQAVDVPCPVAGALTVSS